MGSPRSSRAAANRRRLPGRPFAGARPLHTVWEWSIRKTWPRRLVGALTLIALVLGLSRLALGWWVDREFARVDRELSAGLHGPARERLVRLATLRVDEDRVLYDLGRCERASGSTDRALEAWGRIDPASPPARDAARDRRELLQEYLDRGRLAALEDLLTKARRGSGPWEAEARETLVRLLRFQGRLYEVRQLLHEAWASGADPSGPLRELWTLDSDPPPVERMREVLERAAASEPEDDRVLLGRANLATWSGDFDAAGRLLAACLERRPDDPAVRRAQLEWAWAAGRADEVRTALARLPSEWLDPEEALELRAWMARVRGSREAERQALGEWAELAPGQPRALERLATLAAESGRAEEAGVLRRRKAHLDLARELYRKHLSPDVTTIELRIVGRLAETLGRWFEARGWWSMVLGYAPRDREALEALARLERRPDPGPVDRWIEEIDRLAGGGAEPARAPATAARPTFVDEAETVGLSFRFENGRTAARHLPETMGGGVGLLDFDGDGWLDVYCVQGGPFPPANEDAPAGDRLFRNRGDGTFEDATRSAGIPALSRGYGHGVAVGDYDNDGRPDLFLTRWRSYALARNRGDGTFEDTTESAGLAGDRDWPTSAAWADLDNDGDLDLYVCHYLAYDVGHAKGCGHPVDVSTNEYCDPRQFEALPDRIFRNDAGRFVEITAEAGFADRARGIGLESTGEGDGRGLGVVAADIDDDRRIDLFVANDTTANFLFRNLGGLRFEEVGVPSGVASNGDGGFQAGMGVACADLDGDGVADLAVTNFFGEATTLYRGLGGGLFGDQSRAAGVSAASRSLLGFGISPLDFDNDGRMDLATANGHVNDYRPNVPYAMPVQLLAGVGDGRMVDVSTAAGPPLSVPRVGRGLAAGDLDNDGRVDLIVVAHDAPVAYFRNRTAGGHFVTLRLEGTDSNRDGVGARVVVTSGGQRQVLQRVGGGSYLSAPDPRLHVGLGRADRVDAIEVAWPSGRVDRHVDLPADAGYLIREGDDRPSPLPGYRRGDPRG